MMEKRITFCLITSGEETEAECLAAASPFFDRCVFQEVRNVSPQLVALNQMIDQVETPYLVPLDADMLLDPDALERIERAIDKYAHDVQWHSILFHLFDTLTEEKILALKILRSEVMKKHRFVEGPTPDVEHFARLTEAGYTCITNYLQRPPIGKHVVRGHHFCYHKYRDVYLTLRTHDKEWDSSVFKGGGDVREKSKRHFDYFFYKHVVTQDPDYLSCIAGMLDGLTSPIDHRSKDLSKREYSIALHEGAGQYMEWYAETTEAMARFF
jgi:hypothetical protein